MTLIYFMRETQRFSIQKNNQLGSKGDGNKNIFKLNSYNQVINQSGVIAGITAIHHVLITLATPLETAQFLSTQRDSTEQFLRNCCAQQVLLLS